jgi:hypothetical protein
MLKMLIISMDVFVVEHMVEHAAVPVQQELVDGFGI